MNKELMNLVHRFMLIDSEVLKLQSQILEILKDINFKRWRMAVPGLSEEALSKYSQIYKSFMSEPEGMPTSEQESINDLRDSLVQLQDVCRMIMGEEQFNDVINDIIITENNSTVESCLSNVYPKRVSAGLRIKLGIIVWWLLFRIQIETTKQALSIKSMAHGGEIDNYNNAVSYFVELLESMPLPPPIQQEVQSLGDIHRPCIHEVTKEDEDRLLKLFLSVYELRLGQWNNLKIALFQLINNIFIPISVRRKIVNCIQQTVFKKILQKEYNLRKSYIPEISSWKFYLPNKLDTNTVLPTDFSSEKREIHQGMNFNLKHEEIVNLYTRLRGKYIDLETDIEDFAFALTGYPAKRKNIFKKVSWINDSKQSLGIFMGLMRPANMERNRYWSHAVKFFSYKGGEDNLKASDLSTPYGKFLNHPETRGQIWEELSTLIASSIKQA